MLRIVLGTQDMTELGRDDSCLFFFFFVQGKEMDRIGNGIENRAE